jgi:hypothetical protein
MGHKGMSWYAWTDLAAFSTWHDAACAALGIPHPGRNAATGEVDPDAQWTVAYTEPVVGSDVRAAVEDYVAVLVPDGLGVASVAPESDDASGA